ncbi:porin family protein [Aequorivita antarctica]|nr:porin family protein [Aequorivita antarctica]SRX75184.1 hypothetical protein AEQU3_02178 [Aequorivita antarctica]
MKKKVSIGLILGMIFLQTNTFSQTNEFSPEKGKNDTETAKTYLSPLLNMVNTDLNYGKSNNTLTDSKKSEQGLQIGATFQAGITPNFSLVSELYFITKGGKLKENISAGIPKSSLRLYTIESPLLARFNIGRFYLNAGPSIAYNVSGTYKTEGISKNLSFNNSTEDFKRWDAGIQAGAGYRFKIKQKPVALDIRYAYGLTNISNTNEMYNRYLNIGLYFTTQWKKNPLGKKRSS